MEAISAPLVSGWVEDFRPEAMPGGGTRLSWTMALDNRLLRRIYIPRSLQQVLNRFAGGLMSGFRTILPAPETKPQH